MAETIERLQPTHVLIEGPADFTDRIDELRLDHKLPIALYSHVRRGAHTRVTWAAFTDWSPEWIALRSASKVSAEVRLIDLPAWHPAFDGPPDEYSVAATVLAAGLGLDTVDAMWDHVVESRADTLTVEELTAVLDDYFDAIRVGDATVSEREQYMASWIRAARERPGSGAVVVVCGGRHRPAIMSELARGRPTDGFWPAVPTAGLMSTSAVTWSPIPTVVSTWNPHGGTRSSGRKRHRPGRLQPRRSSVICDPGINASRQRISSDSVRRSSDSPLSVVTRCRRDEMY